MWAALSRHRGIVFVGVLFALPFVLLYAQSRSPRARGPVVGVVVDVAGGLERAMLWATGGMTDFMETYVTAVGNAEELARLRQNAMSVEVLRAEVQELEVANEALRALAGVAARIDGPRPIGARVIGRSGAPLARIARIDRGRRDGIKRGDGVMTTGGLVGRVLDAGATTSDILLATDPASAIDVVVQRTRARGIVRGRGGADAYAAEVQDFDRLADIREDDVLVTSGLDPALPAGVYVGKITSVARHEDGIYQRAEVTPGADLSTVEHVLVLISRQKERRPQVAQEEPADEAPEGALLMTTSPSSEGSKENSPTIEPPKLVPKLVPKPAPKAPPPAVKPAAPAPATPTNAAPPKPTAPAPATKATPAPPAPATKAMPAPPAAKPTAAKPAPDVPAAIVPPTNGPALKPSSPGATP